MIGQTSGRFFVALGMLTVGAVLVNEIVGNNVGLWIALGFGLLWVIQNNLEGFLARPVEWATGLLTG